MASPGNSQQILRRIWDGFKTAMKFLLAFFTFYAIGKGVFIEWIGIQNQFVPFIISLGLTAVAGIWFFYLHRRNS